MATKTRAHTEQPALAERIISDPSIHGGKPVVKGTRVPVERLLAQLAAKPDLSDLFALYPELAPEDVQAVMAYARAAVQSVAATGGLKPTDTGEDIWANIRPGEGPGGIEAERRSSKRS